MEKVVNLYNNGNSNHYYLQNMDKLELLELKAQFDEEVNRNGNVTYVNTFTLKQGRTIYQALLDRGFILEQCKQSAIRNIRIINDELSAR